MKNLIALSAFVILGSACDGRVVVEKTVTRNIVETVCTCPDRVFTDCENPDCPGEVIREVECLGGEIVSDRSECPDPALCLFVYENGLSPDTPACLFPNTDPPTAFDGLIQVRPDDPAQPDQLFYVYDGFRFPFPYVDPFMSWFGNGCDACSQAQLVTQADASAIVVGRPIKMRPGSIIKIQSDPKTYVVTECGIIRWIETEAVATDLLGTDWNQAIKDVRDVFFVDYTIGETITDASQVDLEALAERTFVEELVCEPTGLHVSLASDTPASQTIPQGAASVSFITVRMKSDGTGIPVLPISRLTFRLGGVGAVSNVESVSLYVADPNLRYGDPRFVDPTTREVSFDVGFGVADGETRDCFLRVDVAPDVGGGDTARFDLVAVETTVPVFGLPVQGNTMSFSSVSAGTMVIAKDTTPVTDPADGEQDAVIARFTMTPTGEGGALDTLTLSVPGGSGEPASLEIFTLRDENEQLAECYFFILDGKFVVCPLDVPVFQDDGETRHLQLRADVFVGTVGEEIKVAVQAKTDVVAFGETFGFNMAVDISGYDDVGDACVGPESDCSFSTIVP